MRIFKTACISLPFLFSNLALAHFQMVCQVELTVNKIRLVETEDSSEEVPSDGEINSPSFGSTPNNSRANSGTRSRTSSFSASPPVNSPLMRTKCSHRRGNSLGIPPTTVKRVLSQSGGSGNSLNLLLSSALERMPGSPRIETETRPELIFALDNQSRTTSFSIMEGWTAVVTTKGDATAADLKLEVQSQKATLDPHLPKETQIKWATGNEQSLTMDLNTVSEREGGFRKMVTGVQLKCSKAEQSE